jgi:hypothetical protein
MTHKVLSYEYGGGICLSPFEVFAGTQTECQNYINNSPQKKYPEDEIFDEEYFTIVEV